MASDNSANDFNGLKKKQRSLEDLLQVLYRRRYILLYSLLLTMAAVILFNSLSTPVYESTVSLKKEKPKENSMQDIYEEMILLQTRDEIETEMELAATREVLKKTADGLMLYLNIDRYVPSENATQLEINKPLAEYEHEYVSDEAYKKHLPRITKLQMQPLQDDYKHIIKCIGTDSFQVFDYRSGKSLGAAISQPKDSADTLTQDYEGNLFSGAAVKSKIYRLQLPQYAIEFQWPDAKPGSKLYYSIKQYDGVIDGLAKNVSVSRIAKTDIFQIEVKANSPYMAYLIANTMSDKYREVRLEQQKLNIRSAFNFADKQIKEVQNKLMKADQELSKYKSTANITSISENSKELVDFIGNLEAEKVKTELDLSEYQKKVAQMEDELKNNEYIDQTYLTPERTDRTDSPFSILQKQLADLELQRIHLLEKKKSTHPDVIMIENQIKQAKEKLAKYNKNTLTAYRIIINSQKKKYDDLSNLSKKYNMKVKALPAQESKLAELKRNRDVFEKMFVALLDKREEMRMAEVSKLQDILIVEAANLPQKPVFPNKLLNYAVGILFGLIAGLFAIIIVEFLKRRKVNLDNIENDLPFPLLAIIPKYSKQLVNKVKEGKSYYDKFVIMMDDTDGFRESFRVLRTKLSHALEDKSKIILFTSCEENTGKTSVISNLAISMAMAGKNVLLVDMDLRRATLSKTFRTPEEMPGIISYLSETTAYPNVYCPSSYKESEKLPRTLDVLPSGGTREASSELLASERLSKLFNIISSSHYDYILIDTPPITRVTDVLVIGKIIKNVVVLIRPEFTYKDSIRWGIMEMQQINMNILGSVANASEIEKSSYRYGYGYGYSYNSSDTYKNPDHSKAVTQSRTGHKGKIGAAGL